MKPEGNPIEALQKPSKALFYNLASELDYLLLFYISGLHNIDYDNTVAWFYGVGGIARNPTDVVIDGTITGLWEGGMFIGRLDITVPGDVTIYHPSSAEYATGDLGSGTIEYVAWNWNHPASPFPSPPPAGEYASVLYDDGGNELQRKTINLGQEDIDPQNQFPVIIYPENGSSIADRTPAFHWLRFPGEYTGRPTMENYIQLWGPIHSPNPIVYHYYAPRCMDQEFFNTYPGPDLEPGEYELNLSQNVLIQDVPTEWSLGESYVGHNRKIRFTIVSAITAQMDFNPNTLNLSSNGKWVTVYITLPGDYDVQNINVGTIRLCYKEQSVPANRGNVQNGVFMVKFSREGVADMLDVGEAIELTIKGELIDGTGFEGSDTIRVISH